MIKFGTAGWRGIIGEEFTFHNVRIAAQAISNYLKNRNLDDRALIIGYDTRFLSEKFAFECARVISGNKLMVLFCQRDTPTPVLSYEVMTNKLAGAINITASHNPPEYNGLKFSDEAGAPATSEITKDIEEEIARLLNKGNIIFQYINDIYIEPFIEKENYINHLQKQIKINTIVKSNFKIAIDPLFGTARDYLDKILIDNGCIVSTIHNFRDPLFGGYGPEISEHNLAELKAFVRENNHQLGLATDVDADRFAVINESGEYVSANTILSLIADYLASKGIIKKSIGRSVSTTHLLDRIAESHNLSIIETPVGFKHLAQLLKKDEIDIACEESAGFTLQGHIPEKDGILTNLLVAEIISEYQQPLTKLIENLYTKYGHLFYLKDNFPLTFKLKKRFEKFIKNPPSKINGKKVIKINSLDGIKLYLENNNWILLRYSGTEPIIRIYAESENLNETKLLISSIKNYLKI